jgi:N-acetyl-anhydromuramyl-L-alanine amidase AmpD
MIRRPLRPSALAALLLLGCAEKSPVEPNAQVDICSVPVASVVAAGSPSLPLDSLFEAAGAEFGVPAELLKAIGFVETRWQMVESHPEFPGQPAAYGIMALKGEQVGQGARLAGVSEAEARTGPAANIRAAAALLRGYAEAGGLRPTDLGAWAPAVARYSGIALPEGRAAYVHDDVFGTLRRGVPRGSGAPGSDAAITPLDVRAHFPVAPAATAASADYAAAVWRASPNINARPAGDIGTVAMVIIHTCEGSYTGCWSWLVNPDSRVSAHYVVREDGSQIMQLVREADRGWHIGSTYDCRLNQNQDCWRNGQSNNHFTIGIEHAGFASQASWSVAQLDASARLVCDLTRRHGITRDNIRILGHAQLQPHNRTDPGANWPWASFYARINAHCTDGADDATGELVVDSDNAGSDRTLGYASVPGGWTAATATPGYRGLGYHFAPTGTAADPAVFHFYLPAPASRTVDAWWTAGSNRSARAAFHAIDASGRTLATVHANQQTAGSRWNTLGTWHFPQGWNRIQLSREGGPGCVVIADAVRVR